MKTSIKIAIGAPAAAALVLVHHVADSSAAALAGRVGEAPSPTIAMVSFTSSSADVIVDAVTDQEYPSVRSYRVIRLYGAKPTG